MRIRVFIMLFFLLSAFLIISNGNLHMKKGDEAKKFVGVYYEWLIDTSINIFKSTAYVVKFDWLPEKNKTVINETNRNVNKSENSSLNKKGSNLTNSTNSSNSTK